RQGVRVARVAWTPSLRADRLATLWRDEIDTANRTALERLLEAHPFLVDVRPAIDLIPGMTRDTILHAGPPIAWERMSGPMRGAVGGALVYEGLARTIADAERAASRGDVRFSPCHHHGSVGPMAGIITASMPVFVVENRAHGLRAAGEAAGAGSRGARSPARRALAHPRLRSRQRALLPESRHGGVQDGDGRRPRRGGVDPRDGDGAQRHRLRHPRERPRRSLV